MRTAKTNSWVHRDCQNQTTLWEIFGALKRGMKPLQATRWDVMPLELVPRHKRRSVHASPTAQANDDLAFRFNRTKVEFLNTEIEAARTFLDIALSTRDPASKKRNVHRARRAYAIIQRGLQLVTLTDGEAQFVHQNLKSLNRAFANL